MGSDSRSAGCRLGVGHGWLDGGIRTEDMQRIARVGLLALALATAWTIGCTSRASQLWVHAHRHGETLTQTSEEHNRAVIESVDQDRRALMDDLDLMYMTDRTSRLTRWHSR